MIDFFGHDGSPRLECEPATFGPAASDLNLMRRRKLDPPTGAGPLDSGPMLFCASRHESTLSWTPVQ